MEVFIGTTVVKMKKISENNTNSFNLKYLEKLWNLQSYRPILRGLLPLEKKKILVHISVYITTQGRTKWRTPPRFDPRFLLYFHKIVRLTATGFSISPFSKSLCLFDSPKSPLVSNLND